MTESVTKTFSATGYSAIIQVPAGQAMKYTLSGTFSATVELETTDDLVNGTWEVVYTNTAPTTEEFTASRPGEQGSVYYRAHCTARASGTATALIEAIAAVQEDVDVTGLVNIDGVIDGLVTVYIKNGDGDAVLASCAIANIPTGAGYAKGCILTATDGTDEDDTAYYNVGDATTASFVAFNAASTP